MLPGFSAELMPKGREKESQAKNKCSFVGWGRNSHGLVNSLTCLAELDSSNPKLMNELRIIRKARGSGLEIREHMSKVFSPEIDMMGMFGGGDK
ncbi:unnamed protein product [Prunus armeniaca]|uniref:Uncharacterized protein n=1 Tax=Prunus armeniaca TaxID=36596 RepID=A0A6J5VN04_PRUAR|nr:unnamed protein product [Prunus armeniaca]